MGFIHGTRGEDGVLGGGPYQRFILGTRGEWGFIHGTRGEHGGMGGGPYEGFQNET